MLLGKNNVQLEFDVTKSISNIGLSDDDYWCCVHFFIKSADINLDSSIDLISWEEYLDFIQKLRFFLSNDSVQKSRITFIKNYFVIYLESGLRFGKRMRIKLIHINNDNNYVLYLFDEEISQFLDYLESFKCVIDEN